MLFLKQSTQENHYKPFGKAKVPWKFLFMMSSREYFCSRNDDIHISAAPAVQVCRWGRVHVCSGGQEGDRPWDLKGKGDPPSGLLIDPC